MDSKIKLLAQAMEVKERADKTEFTCFTDEAPQELKDIFIAHYEVRDTDYKIFSEACDAIVNAYDEKPEDLREYMEENANDFASIYTAERLSYLSIWNDEEVADIFKEYSCSYISEACAIWYDQEVKTAIYLIIDTYLIKA